MTMFYYTKILTNIKVLKIPRQDPLVLPAQIIGSHQKRWEIDKVHKFSKTVGTTSEFQVPGRRQQARSTWGVQVVRYPNFFLGNGSR